MEASSIPAVSPTNAASNEAAPAGQISGVPASIVRATQYGDFELFRSLIETSQYDVNRLEDNISLLHWAAINNRLNFVKYLLVNGANINRIGGDLQSTPLMWAVRQGHLAMIVLLMNNGADASILDSEGYNALHLAVLGKKTTIVAYLLACGVDVDAVDRNGLTALMIAAYKIHSTEPARLLIQFQANVDARDKLLGNTPFCWAAMSGNAPVIRVLTECGADATLENSKSFGPSAIALQFQQFYVYGDLVRAEQESAMRKQSFPLSIICSQKARAKFAFVFPTIAVFIICSMMELSYAWWIKLLAISGILVAITAFIKTLVDNSYSQRLPFGLMVTTKLVLFVTFYWFFRYYMDFWIACGFYLSLTASAIFAALARSQRSEVAAANIQDKTYLIKTMAERPHEIPIGEYCSMCVNRRPLRSKHCFHCNRCVILFDHHSFWLYTCIGWRNQKYYVAYLLAFVSTMVINLYSCYVFWNSVDSVKCIDEVCGNMLIRIASYSPSLVNLAALSCFVHLSWSLTYLIFLLHQITFVGMTTNERFNAFRNRIFQTRKIGIFHSPFNHGVIQNWCNFCECKIFGRKPTAIDWRRVYSIDDYRKESVRERSSNRLLPV